MNETMQLTWEQYERLAKSIKSLAGKSEHIPDIRGDVAVLAAVREELSAAFLGEASE